MLDKCISIDRNTDAERPFRRSTFALRSMQMLSDLHLSSKLTSSIIITRGPNAIAVLHHHWNIEIILLPIVLCKTRRLLIPAREDEVAPRPCTGRRGNASSPCREMPISTVSPGSRRSAYRYPLRSVRTAHIGRYKSK
ncbi:hypothetical protein BHM03_00062359 [Ensete ventricosum]|nr:hypothetical protein BHM03_00062359 [Ensete ventricosum]